MKEVHTINYYPINEGAARRAKEMNSFSDYKEGSATAEYRAMVDKAAAIAEQQKSRVDPMYHEKIDHLLHHWLKEWEKGQLVIRSCFGRPFLPAFLPLPAYGSTERGG